MRNNASNLSILPEEIASCLPLSPEKKLNRILFLLRWKRNNEVSPNRNPFKALMRTLAPGKQETCKESVCHLLFQGTYYF